MKYTGVRAIAFAIVFVGVGIAGARTPPPPAKGEPAVTLRLDGKLLKYTYDLSTVFDPAMWKVLEDNGYSEITVQVRLRDAADKVTLSQYHSLKIELLERGRVRVMTSRRRGRIYKSRHLLLSGLKTVPGTPIAAKDFAGSAGHLELVVLVNPVQVYDFPARDAPLAKRQVVPRTYYDRRVEMRSRSFHP